MFYLVKDFEDKIAEFFGAPYCVAVDCCTHAIELCLRKEKPSFISCPSHTYPSVPMTFMKLGTDWTFDNREWENLYQISNTKIYDAAVLWKKDSYVPNSYMCLSFQFRKHLSLGRGGAILCETKEDYMLFKKMSYDGRLPDVPWTQQNIEELGYHYYMTPETAKLGLEKLEKAILEKPKIWNWQDYSNLTNMKVFQNVN